MAHDGFRSFPVPPRIATGPLIPIRFTLRVDRNRFDAVINAGKRREEDGPCREKCRRLASRRVRHLSPLSLRTSVLTPLFLQKYSPGNPSPSKKNNNPAALRTAVSS